MNKGRSESEDQRLPRPRATTRADERVADVRFTEDELSVTLMDDRTISVPLTWYLRLLHATKKQRRNWETCAAGYGIHWPDIDEDLSTEGLLRGAPSTTCARHETMRRKRHGTSFVVCVRNEGYEASLELRAIAFRGGQVYVAGP